MKFHGIFIGVDRYWSPDIGFLSSAVRDATALYALFADGFGGEPVLLADADATKNNIVAELQRLANVSSDEDLVVVSFSGHGSTTHELVPYDADRSRLADTALPLEELAKLLNQIPAATLLCVLDCCFSGGFGAKVLVAPVQARDLESESDLLEQIAGKGRIVLAASAPNERAYEDVALGHGLLTYELLAGLQGAPEVVSAGKVDLYKLLEHVTRRVRIGDLHRAGHGVREIAAEIGRNASMISRELRHNRDLASGSYRPFTAQRMAVERRARPGRGKLIRDSQLRGFVAERLTKRWSPEQIAHALRMQFPDQPDRHLAAETIYQ